MASHGSSHRSTSENFQSTFGRTGGGVHIPVDVRGRHVVLVRWKGNYLLHLVKEADAERLLIGNNLGKTNGWVDRQDVRGLVETAVCTWWSKTRQDNGERA